MELVDVNSFRLDGTCCQLLGCSHRLSSKSRLNRTRVVDAQSDFRHASTYCGSSEPLVGHWHEDVRVKCFSVGKWAPMSCSASIETEIASTHKRLNSGQEAPKTGIAASLQHPFNVMPFRLGMAAANVMQTVRLITAYDGGLVCAAADAAAGMLLVVLVWQVVPERVPLPSISFLTISENSTTSLKAVSKPCNNSVSWEMHLASC